MVPLLEEGSGNGVVPLLEEGSGNGVVPLLEEGSGNGVVPLLEEGGGNGVVPLLEEGGGDRVLKTWLHSATPCSSSPRFFHPLSLPSRALMIDLSHDIAGLSMEHLSQY